MILTSGFTPELTLKLQHLHVLQNAEQRESARGRERESERERSEGERGEEERGEVGERRESVQVE